VARGQLRLEARHAAGLLSIVLADDGRGIDVAAVRRKIVERDLASSLEVDHMSDAEALDHVFVPGFSTAAEVSDLSGRGVGLDVVKSVLAEIGGAIRVSTVRGHGTRFDLQLPLTLSVIRAVLVEIAGEPYALPLLRLDRLAKVRLADIHTIEGRPYFKLEERHLALVPARQVLGLAGDATEADPVCVAVIGDRRLQLGIVVDAYLGEQDLVVQPLDARLGIVPDVAATAVASDGAPLVILDVEGLVTSAQRILHQGQAARLGPAAPRPPRPRKRILVCDDSITVREVQRQLLRSHGFDVQVATDGMEGWQIARAGDLDLVITDVEMPRMNGIELVRSIKQHPKLASLPVIIVSYRDRPEDRNRGMEAGANYYLAKSDFHDEALLGAVTELIGEPEK
jgi:two-component system, chemotaxis family, sensor histidine kinase and response regulator WspE